MKGNKTEGKGLQLKGKCKTLISRKNKSIREAKSGGTNTHSTKQLNKAFTLMELIVVMAILVVLVTIAAPQFKDTLHEARVTNIINDIRVMESQIELDIIAEKDQTSGWEKTEANLSEIATNKRLYTIDKLYTGSALGGTYLEIPPNTIKTQLTGQFYLDKADNKVYYADTRDGVPGQPSEPGGGTETTDTGIYGLQWNQTQGKDRAAIEGGLVYTRLGDASDVVKASPTNIGTQITEIEESFNNYGPWKNIRRVILKDDGTVYAVNDGGQYVVTEKYDAEDGGTLTIAEAENGTYGQVMVEIPKFYYKTEMTDGTDTGEDKIYKWYVSETEHDGYKLHPAFISGVTEYGKVYLGAYEGFVPTDEADKDKDKLQSIAGKEPTVSKTIGAFRTHATNRNFEGTTGWGQQDFTASSAVQLLYLIEYATFDTQTAIGKGVTDSTNPASVNTGATSTLGNGSGNADNDGANGKNSVSYRGIENFWGNVYKWVDGLNVNEHAPYVANSEYESNKFDGPYTKYDREMPSSGYVTDILYNSGSGNDYGFLASSTVGGNTTTGLHDHVYTATAKRAALLGGSWTYGADAGGFRWNVSNSPSRRHAHIGARLLYR